MAIPTPPISEHIQRALLYIKLANDGGAFPAPHELDAYATQSEPRPKRTASNASRMMKMLENLEQSNGWGFTVQNPDAVSQYMRRLGWIKSSGSGLQLTKLGKGIANSLIASQNDVYTEEQGVVLSPDDPARYELMIRAISAAKAGLVADPYLKVSQIAWLAASTNISRALVGSHLKKPEIAEVGHALGRLDQSQGGALTVRISDSKQFHDRLILGEDGDMWQIGASLNGLHKNITAIIPIPQVIIAPMSQHLEQLWESATPIESRTDMTGSDLSGELLEDEK